VLNITEVIMAYVKKITQAGNRIRVEKYYTSRYGSKGKCTRSQNYGSTPENMAVRNARYAYMKADDIFNENFSRGDLTITFTFAKDKRPKNTNELKEIWRGYIRQVRTAYKKAGVTLKWQKGIDPDKNNPHIHIALTSIDVKLLPEWKYGGVHIRPVEDRDNHTFGSYAKKQGADDEEKPKEFLPGKSLCCYSHSRNCVIPEPKITVISNDHWSEEPIAPKGWYIFEKKIDNWEDEVNGYKHQSYILCKLPDKKKRKPKSKRNLSSRQ